MFLRNLTWYLLVGLVVVGLPVAGHWSRQTTEVSCALDGTPIDPVYRVEVVDDNGGLNAFCCLRCAELWLQRQTTSPRAIRVTDETSGTMIDATAAWYVRSMVVTTPATRNRVHVFANQTDAEKHAAAHVGTVLIEQEKPFHGGNGSSPHPGELPPFQIQ